MPDQTQPSRGGEDPLEAKCLSFIYETLMMLMLIVMMMMLMLMFLMLMLMCLFQTVDMDEGNANSNINSIVGDVLKSKESCESNNIALFNTLILIESCIIAFGTRFSFCPPF